MPCSDVATCPAPQPRLQLGNQHCCKHVHHTPSCRVAVERIGHVWCPQLARQVEQAHKSVEQGRLETLHAWGAAAAYLDAQSSGSGEAATSRLAQLTC